MLHDRAAGLKLRHNLAGELLLGKALLEARAEAPLRDQDGGREDGQDRPARRRTLPPWPSWP